MQRSPSSVSLFPSFLRGNDECARGMTCRGTGVILHVEVTHVE